jgi:hypothetical protein
MHWFRRGIKVLSVDGTKKQTQKTSIPQRITSLHSPAAPLLPEWEMGVKSTF